MYNYTEFKAMFDKVFDPDRYYRDEQERTPGFTAIELSVELYSDFKNSQKCRFFLLDLWEEKEIIKYLEDLKRKRFIILYNEIQEY